MLFGLFKQQAANDQKENALTLKITNNNNTKSQNQINNHQTTSFNRKISFSKEFTDIGSVRQEKIRPAQKVNASIVPLTQRQNKQPSILNSQIKSQNNKLMKKQTGSDITQLKNYGETQHPLARYQMDTRMPTQNSLLSDKRNLKKYDQKEEVQKLIYQYSNTKSTQQLTAQQFEQLIQDVYQSMCGVDYNLSREQMKTIMLLVDTDRNGAISKQQLSRIVIDSSYKPRQIKQ